MSTNSPHATMNKISISVAIAQQQGGYSWRYALLEAPPGVSIHGGHGTLYIPDNQGPDQIEYILDAEASLPSIDLVYANLNLKLQDGITAQIKGITIHRDMNRIALQFENQNQREFGVFLIARDRNNPNLPIVSPDPQVTNDPNSQPPAVGP